MQARLVPHPDTPSAAATSLTVDIAALAGRRMRLVYNLQGRMARIVIPLAASCERADELWKHTCFEAFFRKRQRNGYAEFNFSPSTQWAAYGFERYRGGMTNLVIGAPEINAMHGADSFVLNVVFEIPDADRLALSAVVEEGDGSKSYWALAHAPGQPDFHHAESFAIDLGAI